MTDWLRGVWMRLFPAAMLFGATGVIPLVWAVVFVVFWIGVAAGMVAIALLEMRKDDRWTLS